MWVMGLPSIDYCEGWVNLEYQKTRLQVMTVPIDENLVKKMEIRSLQLMVEVWQLASRASNQRDRRLRTRPNAGVLRRINTSKGLDVETIPMRAAPNGFNSFCQSSIR